MQFPIRKQQQVQPQKNIEECKIKIKETKTGRELQFKGNCSKEQLRIASESLGTNNIRKLSEEELDF